MGRKARDNSAVKNPGRAIRLKREAIKWSLDQLSGASGISKASLSRIENGEQNFRYSTINQIAKGLGCQTSELFVEPFQEIVARLRELSPDKLQKHLERIRAEEGS